MNISKRIEKMLQQLKDKDAKLEVFGAGDNPWYDIQGHHYELNPVATEEEIVHSEEMLGITFPEEYREFIKRAGNGGAGPAWGLYELTNTHPDQSFLDRNSDFATQEFPCVNSYTTRLLKSLKDDISFRGEFYGLLEDIQNFPITVTI